MVNQLTSYPVLRFGDSGPDVKELQGYLISHSYNVEVDGIFGEETLNAVKDFQAHNDLTADGIVGNDTWSALIENLD